MADPISLVAILVPPIISGLVTTFQLIMNARARRKEKKLKLKEQAQAAEQQLVTTLEVGPKRIDEKYELLLHLGKAYQEVDPVAKNALLSISLKLNNSLIDIVQKFLAAGKLVFAPHQYNSWNVVGTEITHDTVATLSDLYRRKLTSIPTPIAEIRIYPDGQYKGALQDGKRHGHGEMTYTSGDKYKGEWKNDLMDGEGEYLWKDGGKYVGRMKGGKQHGYGTRTWPNGNKYEGNWENGQFTGLGKYTLGGAAVNYVV